MSVPEEARKPGSQMEIIANWDEMLGKAHVPILPAIDFSKIATLDTDEDLWNRCEALKDCVCTALSI